MPISLKVLLSLAIEVICGATGGLLGAGIVIGCLWAGEMGPGAGVSMMLFGVIGLVVGLIMGAAGIVVSWRRVGASTLPLPPVQGDTADGVWPPAPSRSKTAG